MLEAAAGGGLLLPLKALLSRSDVDVNHVGNANWMALRCAIRGGHIEAIDALCAAGADTLARVPDYGGKSISCLELLRRNHGEKNPAVAAACTRVLVQYGAIPALHTGRSDSEASDSDSNSESECTHRSELQRMSMSELKQLAAERGVVPTGNKRYKDTSIDALL